MTDRALLELAAQAAGYKVELAPTPNPAMGLFINDRQWRPLDDNGDAFALMVTLRLRLEVNESSVVVYFPQRDDGDTPFPLYIYPPAKHTGDGATVRYYNHEETSRRAVVLAAAEIGRAMP